MKEFNLEEAKAGKSVCTRHGMPARIICFDANRKISGVNFPIVALIQESDNSEVVRGYTADGKYNAYNEDSLDLMMKTTKHEGWINIYSGIINRSIIPGNYIFSSKEEAIKKSSYNSDYIATAKIEWEE